MRVKQIVSNSQTFSSPQHRHNHDRLRTIEQKLNAITVQQHSTHQDKLVDRVSQQVLLLEKKYQKETKQME